jgi:hypothetical protein
MHARHDDLPSYFNKITKIFFSQTLNFTFRLLFHIDRIEPIWTATRTNQILFFR